MSNDFSSFLNWNSLWRSSLVQFCLILVMLLNLVSFPFPFSGEIRPYFILMVIYYWSIFRPSFLLPFFVFVIGVLYDLILGFPVGLHSFFFVLAQFLVTRQRLFLMGQPFVMMWLGFLFLSSLFILLEWLFFSVYLLKIVPVIPLVGSVVLTVAVFPLISFLFSSVSKILLPVPHSSVMKNK